MQLNYYFVYIFNGLIYSLIYMYFYFHLIFRSPGGDTVDRALASQAEGWVFETQPQKI